MLKKRSNFPPGEKLERKPPALGVREGGGSPIDRNIALKAM